MLFYIALVLASLVAYSGAHPGPQRPLGHAPGGPVHQGSIIGGQAASEGEFPWQLQLQRSGAFTCGAVLLSAERALTAGHCVDGVPASQLRVVAGLLDRTDIERGQLSNVFAYEIHQGYGTAGFDHDLAMLTLDNLVDQGPGVQYARLPPNNNSDREGQACTFSGWGRTTSSNVMPEMLRKATMTVIGSSDCNTRLGLPGFAGPGTICLIDPSNAISTCTGDDGGPLQCTDLGTNVLAGIASYSVNCLPERPSIYVRVAFYLEWINARMGGRN
jgi:trypsin